MSSPLLSVVIPCYNVGKYLDRCISSIVNQTYSELEIIIVNDGSTDKTGDLCDNWQKKDQRIRVIHQQNEGSSLARKTGLENSTAEYITFVDSDDWLDIKMYAELMSALLSTGSDIAQCDLIKVYEGDAIKPSDDDNNKDVPLEIVERKAGVISVLEDRYNSSLCNKIFKKHLFEHVVFPPKRSFGDDVTIVFLLFHHALQSVYVHRTYYFYYQGEGSICRDKRRDIQFKPYYCDYWDSIYDSYLFALQHPEYHAALPCLQHRLFTLGLQGMRMMAAYPHFFPENSFEKYSQRLNAITFSWKYLIFRLSNPIKISEFLFLKISRKSYKNMVSFLAKVKREKG